MEERDQFGERVTDVVWDLWFAVGLWEIMEKVFTGFMGLGLRER